MKLGMEFAIKTEKNMTLRAPVIGKIIGRVFNKADADVIEISGAPSSVASFALVNSGLD